MDDNSVVIESDYQMIRRFLKMMLDTTRSSRVAGIQSSIEEDLTPRQRQLVNMYYLEQMRMQDIADELGVDISTVSRTLKRARANMANHLRYSGRTVLDVFEPD